MVTKAKTPKSYGKALDGKKPTRNAGKKAGMAKKAASKVKKLRNHI